jgi:hypothetical protein
MAQALFNTSVYIQREKRDKTPVTYRQTPVLIGKVLQIHEAFREQESALLVHIRVGKLGLKDFLFDSGIHIVLSSPCLRDRPSSAFPAAASIRLSSRTGSSPIFPDQMAPGPGCARLNQ